MGHNTSASHTSTLEFAEVVVKIFPFEDPSVDAIEASDGSRVKFRFVLVRMNPG